MAPGALRVSRTDSNWEHEISAWVWRAVLLMFMVFLGVRLAVNPHVLPLGTEFWPANALVVAQVVGVVIAADGVRQLVRSLGGALTVVGRRPLVRVEASGQGVDVLVHRLAWTAVRVPLSRGDVVSVAQVDSRRIEHRGKAVGARQLCDWVIVTPHATVKAEMAWTLDPRVVGELGAMLADHGVSLTRVEHGESVHGP